MMRTTMVKRTGMALIMTAFWVAAANGQQGVASSGAHDRNGGRLPGEAEAGVLAPAPWLQEDPGARAYAQAREALNAARYQEAADAFTTLRSQYPRSVYAADSYYYQAFALSRLGSRAQLRQARSLLQTQITDYSQASTLADSRELLLRVEAQLAQQGDAQAAAAITQQATDPCGPDQELRVTALNALMNMNAERAIPILKQVLENRDACSAELRQQAVFLISQKMDEESVDILLDLAHRNPDPDPEVREQAVFWLSQVRSEEALDALESILRESDDPQLQENAIYAIAQHRSERSGQILRQYAERADVPTGLRENAIFWIGQSPGGTEYLKSIWPRLDTPELKENILHAIAQSDDEADRDWLMDRVRDPSEDMEVRTNALFWVSQSGSFNIGEIRSLFADFSDPEMKEQLIFAASQRNEAEAVDFLMEVAENPDNGELREQAIFWLGQSEDPRVPEFLLRIIGR
ncbi:MAG: HEAT repeat domain-containing protein [Longimicrobiales bacterium]